MRRKLMDASDRNAIITKLKKFQNPLSYKPEDPQTGQVAPVEVNVDKVLTIGENMSAQFKTKLPHRFYSPLKHAVTTMQVARRV